MNPRVKYVQCEDNSHLIITFSNDEIKLFDMLPYFKYPVFESLQDVSFFKKAHVEHGTVAWNDELDIDPDTLYLDGVIIK